MERKGWRAIIYDAPWARFKSGQKGLIISQDGKSCETTDDNITTIEIISTEYNPNLLEGRSGHALFRQKGSDLFDIVCLHQSSGGTYSLYVSDFIINGCEGKEYEKFLEELYIKKTISGAASSSSITITNREEKEELLQYPTEQVFRDNNDFKNESESTIICPIEVSGFNTSASGTLSSTTAGQSFFEYSSTSFSGNATICKSKDYEIECRIEPVSSSGYGGIYDFTLIEAQGYAEFEIDVSDICVYEILIEKKCEEVVGGKTQEVTDVSYNIEGEGGLYVGELTDNKIKISASTEVETVIIEINNNQRDDTASEKITLNIPCEPC